MLVLADKREKKKNMNVSASFDPSADGPQIKFVGVDLEGSPCVFNLRVKTPQVASEIVDKMKKEVEAIKAE